MFSRRARSGRAWLPVLGWCAATLASIAAGTIALQPVLRTATPGAGVPGVDAAAAPPPAAVAPPAASPPATAPAPSRSAAARTSPPSRRPPSPGTGGAPARTLPPGAPAPTVVDGWTVTTAPDGTRTYLRSFRVAGGHAVVRATPGRIELVTATPSEGYAVDTVQTEPGNLAVQFTERDHYFVIHVVWHNDAPFAQVSEVGG